MPNELKKYKVLKSQMAKGVNDEEFRMYETGEIFEGNPHGNCEYLGAMELVNEKEKKTKKSKRGV